MSFPCGPSEAITDHLAGVAATDHSASPFDLVTQFASNPKRLLVVLPRPREGTVCPKASENEVQYCRPHIGAQTLILKGLEQIRAGNSASQHVEVVGPH